MIPDFSAALTRRRFAATAGIAFFLAGCTGKRTEYHEPLGDVPPQTCLGGDGANETGETDETGSAGGRAPDAWPEFGHDAGNTGRASISDGPCVGDVSWTYDGGTPTMNSSPVTHYGVVYGGGSGDPGGLFALDADTGDVQWNVETDGYVTSAPCIHQYSVHESDSLYVGTWGKTFYALDTDDGSTRWSIDVGHRFGTSSPTAVDDTVYVGTLGDGPLVASGPADEDEFEAPALLALDAESGDERWRYDEFDERSGIESSPAVADGRMFLTAERTLFALAADDGSVVWKRSLNVHPRTSPAVRDGVVYCPTLPPQNRDEPHGRLLAVDSATGETLWKTTVEDHSLRTSPAVTGDSVYVAATTQTACPADSNGESACDGPNRGRLHAFDVEGGTHRWTTDIEIDTRSSPAVVGNTVYVGCGNGLSAVTTDGETVFRVEFGEEVYVDSSPAVADGRVFLGCSDGTLYAVGYRE